MECRLQHDIVRAKLNTKSARYSSDCVFLPRFFLQKFNGNKIVLALG